MVPCILVATRRGGLERQDFLRRTSYPLVRIGIPCVLAVLIERAPRWAERLERLWTLLGLAFYVSYCNTAAHDGAFAQRMGRRYTDGRKDLSWLSLAKCAELCGRCDVLFHPVAAQ